MVWSQKNLFSGRIRLGCPVMEFFHPYKKLLEDVWKQPEFFYTFFAPLHHHFFPDSAVFANQKLKMIESIFTVVRMLWPDYRAKFHLLLTFVFGLRRTHLRNILLVMDFFVPLVSNLRSLGFQQTEKKRVNRLKIENGCEY